MLMNYLLLFIPVVLSIKINGPIYEPNCPETVDCSVWFLENQNHSSNNLVWFFSNDPILESRFHFLFTTIDRLSILLIETTPYTEIDTLDYENLLHVKNFSQPCLTLKNGTVKHSFAIEITKIFRYDDPNDKADILFGENVESIPLDQLFWQHAKLENGSLLVQIGSSIDGRNPEFFGPNGTLKLNFELFESDSLAKLSPHLLHNDRAAQFELILENLSRSENQTQKNVRYALEMAIVAHHRKSDQANLEILSTSTINDEYTPGIFETHVMSNQFDDAYLMWKPVCYYNFDRERNSLSRASHTVLKNFENFEPTGLIGAFFGANITGLDVKIFNISFGMPHDKFYSGYLVWTLQIGFGAAPKESFSALIISMIVICMATPLSAAIGGGVYGVYRRMKI